MLSHAVVSGKKLAIDPRAGAFFGDAQPRLQIITGTQHRCSTRLARTLAQRVVALRFSLQSILRLASGDARCISSGSQILLNRPEVGPIHKFLIQIKKPHKVGQLNLLFIIYRIYSQSSMIYLKFTCNRLKARQNAAQRNFPRALFTLTAETTCSEWRISIEHSGVPKSEGFPSRDRYGSR